MKDTRPTLAVDFDGVIHAYSRGWEDGSCYDEPLPGCREALIELDKCYRLVVFTARHDLEAVDEWLRDYRFGHLFKAVTNRKPQAARYVDDKGYHFTSWEQTLEDLRAT